MQLTDQSQRLKYVRNKRVKDSLKRYFLIILSGDTSSPGKPMFHGGDSEVTLRQAHDQLAAPSRVTDGQTLDLLCSS